MSTSSPRDRDARQSRGVTYLIGYPNPGFHADRLLTSVPDLDARGAATGTGDPCCRGSGVDDDGDDEGLAAVGAERPVRHGAGEELFELARVPDAFLSRGGQRLLDDRDDRLEGGVVVDEAAGQEVGGSARAPVSASTIATTVTTPSAARVRRSLRDASVAPPTSMPST